LQPGKGLKMNLREMKGVISRSEIIFDNPHFFNRCDENGITKEWVVDQLKKREIDKLIEDRPKVYKLYYRLSRKTTLKVIVDIVNLNKLNLRTTKVLNEKFQKRIMKTNRSRRY